MESTVAAYGSLHRQPILQTKRELQRVNLAYEVLHISCEGGPVPGQPWDNPPVCDRCGSERVAWAMLGRPGYETEEMQQAILAGRLMMLGDVGICSFWQCIDCGQMIFTPNWYFVKSSFERLKAVLAEADEEFAKTERIRRSARARVRELMLAAIAAAEEVEGKLRGSH